MGSVPHRSRNPARGAETRFTADLTTAVLYDKEDVLTKLLGTLDSSPLKKTSLTHATINDVVERVKIECEETLAGLVAISTHYDDWDDHTELYESLV